MRKINKKLIACLCIVSLTFPQLTGCGKKSGEDYSNQTLTVQVQEINGTKVTAQTGTLNEFKHDGTDSKGTPPSGMPQRPDDGNSKGTPPSGMPQQPENEETTGSGVQPPSDGEMQRPGGFTAGDETVSFTLSDDTSVKIESRNGEEEGSISDITEGTILEVTYDKNNEISSIVIKNSMNRGGKKEDKQTTNQS